MLRFMPGHDTPQEVNRESNISGGRVLGLRFYPEGSELELELAARTRYYGPLGTEHREADTKWRLDHDNRTS